MTVSRKRMKHVAAAFLGLLVVAIVLAVLQIRKMRTVEYWREKTENHPLRSVGAWKITPETPLEKRIAPATDELMDLLDWNDGADRTNSNPRALSPAEYAEALPLAEKAAKQIPEFISKKIGSSLYQIFLVKSLGSGGVFFDVVDARGNIVGGFIVLGTDLLLDNSRSYLTWKDSTAFRPQKGYELVGTMGNKDDSGSSLEYVMLHEIGHLIDFTGSPQSQPGRFSHPRNRTDAPWSPESDFFDLSWSFDGKNYDWAFPRNTKELPHLYFFNELYRSLNPQASRTWEYFDWIETTNYPTLYATTEPREDFAESFATYVFGEVLGNPWDIEVKENGKTIKEFGLCWKEPRCQKKRELLEMVLR